MRSRYSLDTPTPLFTHPPPPSPHLHTCCHRGEERERKESGCTVCERVCVHAERIQAGTALYGFRFGDSLTGGGVKKKARRRRGGEWGVWGWGVWGWGGGRSACIYAFMHLCIYWPTDLGKSPIGETAIRGMKGKTESGGQKCINAYS